MTDETHSPHMISRRLESIFPITDEESQAFKELPVQVVALKADRDIVSIGDRPHQCCMVLEGFTCVYKLSQAGKRQIMALHLPGDIPDLQSLHLAVMDNSIATISPCTVGFIQHADLRRICECYPRLASALWRETLVDAALMREWLLNIGQRDSFTRTAHLLCELQMRLRAVALINGPAFDLPITQEQMADAVGISTVHMNRVFQALRARSLIKRCKSEVTILDWQELQEAGEFEPHYLHLREAVA
ncbi:Crp/Fnr family transcriptional regulator [Billgrantia kenyensis]|uniref:Crp/Fnr family transcriptional regulator n=1 Tax=Billgrantia kenyensis TaxID=321266 RepID=A0A7V9W172_9GAMM|nr:Crp/Fnr family transcriptional regulator [Halomonas kenyensis]MBA2779174.1 Crp/Fnr family transcriptional regulator [Halomonas kenyensis]MCG6660814.1 Crp/Fnr family transcriptional regulator [Halomonas kenyensis]